MMEQFEGFSKLCDKIRAQLHGVELNAGIMAISSVLMQILFNIDDPKKRYDIYLQFISNFDEIFETIKNKSREEIKDIGEKAQEELKNTP